jgi:hypothetical protein
MSCLVYRAQGEDDMITITDVPSTTPPSWEVVDSTGKLEKYNFPYNPNGLYGTNREYVL